MATKLKKGDKVRATRSFYEYLTAGKIYIVAKDQEDEYIWIERDDRDSGNSSLFARRFEKVESEAPASVKDTQVGGSHYTKCGIQPYEYTLANDLGGLEHTIVKYVTRWKDKGGVEDLKKARHTLDFLIEYTEKASV